MHKFFLGNRRGSGETPPAAVSPPPLLPEFADITFGAYALQKLLLSDYSFDTVLDVGSGAGLHSRAFADHNKRVTAIDLGTSIYAASHDPRVEFAAGDYMTHKFPHQFDLVWACHVLEHQPNPNAFLAKLLTDATPGGTVAITVPPAKDQIVGGHVTIWNAGLLLYQLVLAGNNCRDASILRYGYNISLLVTRTPIKELPPLTYDSGDIEQLLPFLPNGLGEPFNGDIREHNWGR